MGEGEELLAAADTLVKHPLKNASGVRFRFQIYMFMVSLVKLAEKVFVKLTVVGIILFRKSQM